MKDYYLSERQDCRMLNLSRSAIRYTKQKEDEGPLIGVLKSLASKKPIWGAEKMTDLIRQELPEWNCKRIRRIYCKLD